MAEATSRKSITELATPRRTHQDQAFQPRTFYHDCGVRCEGYAISHHWRFNKRHTNAPPSQAATNGTSVMVRGVDAIQAIRSYQYPGPGKSASSLIAATKTRQLTASHPQPRRRNPTTLRNEGPNTKTGSKQCKENRRDIHLEPTKGRTYTVHDHANAISGSVKGRKRKVPRLSAD